MVEGMGPHQFILLPPLLLQCLGRSRTVRPVPFACDTSIFVELHLMSFQPLPIPHHTGLFSDLPPSSSDMVPPLSGKPV